MGVGLLREYVWLDGKPLAVIEGGRIFHVRWDQIGRPVLATELIGGVVYEAWTADYLPFGGVHVATGPVPALRFPGQWYQAESGLHQNWHRDYDPTTGRYLQPDPLGLIDGASVYGYARQNPLRYTDPRGEFSQAGACFAGPIPCTIVLGATVAIGVAGLLFEPEALDQPDDDDCCEEIYQRIADAVRDLRRRFTHQGLNKRDQPFTHALEIIHRQRNLRKLIEQALPDCPNFDKSAYYFAWAPVPGPGYRLPRHLWKPSSSGG